MYIKGQGVKQDGIKATEYYTKACDGGIANACRKVGDIYTHGSGVKHDDIKAAKYYTKGCDGGHLYACDRLGFRYFHGQGLKYISIVVFVVFIALIGLFKRIFPFTIVPLIMIGAWLLHVIMFIGDHNLAFIEFFIVVPIFFLVLAFMSLVDSFLLYKEQKKKSE